MQNVSEKKDKKIEDLPKWLKPSLQGVTYWIGHRRSIYRHYYLGESAIVAEISNLVQAHLPDKYRLKCEVQFSKFIKGVEQSSILTEKARTDLVIASVKNKVLNAEYIIEVKRAKASKRSITNDLQRLAAVKREKPNIRCFLIVVSEAYLPDQFVSSKGTAKLKKTKIINTSDCYKVRLVCKAASSFKRISSANYACLIEVFTS